MTLRSFVRVSPLVAVMLLGAGCLGFGGSSSPKGPDGGVYRMDLGTTSWQQMKNLNLGSKVGSIGEMNVTSLAIDPQDQSALYAGTAENGLLLSLDGGTSWMTMRAPEVGAGRINAIAVSSKDKCTVYAARLNQVLKTSNCARDWSQVFFDPRTDKTFSALAIDWFNPSTIYAGTSEGDIFRSQDAGTSWRAVERVEGVRINNLAIDPKDSRVLYAATQGSGLVKTTDGGTTWTEIRKPFQEFENARRVTQVVIDPLLRDVVYTISKYGVLKSEDGGTTWKALALPTQAGAVELRAFAIHPSSSKFLVYATDSSIVMSTNSGVTWSSHKLPTSRSVSSLVFDKVAQPNLFLGALTRKTQ